MKNLSNQMKVAYAKKDGVSERERTDVIIDLFKSSGPNFILMQELNDLVQSCILSNEEVEELKKYAISKRLLNQLGMLAPRINSDDADVVEFITHGTSQKIDERFEKFINEDIAKKVLSRLSLPLQLKYKELVMKDLDKYTAYNFSEFCYECDIFQDLLEEQDYDELANDMIDEYLYIDDKDLLKEYFFDNSILSKAEAYFDDNFNLELVYCDDLVEQWKSENPEWSECPYLDEEQIVNDIGYYWTECYYQRGYWRES